MASTMRQALCLLAVFVCTALLPVATAVAVTSPVVFMNGLSSADDDPASVDQIAAVGATHVRRYVMWGDFVPNIQTLEENLTISALKSNPEALIYAWGATLDWSYGDTQIYGLLSNNITPIVELSEGTHYGLPRYNGTYADPSVIGIDLYLAYQYRFCRAAVHRYKGVITMYQIENELNEAFLSAFAGQRLLSFVWGNWTFLTELLTVLRESVKDEDPQALVTMNFHTDVPKVVHDALHLPGYYLDAIGNWSSLLDVIALDAYPNMYVAQPLACTNVSDRVVASMEKVSHSKPVFIMETGYPVNAPNNTNVSGVFNFSVTHQAEYASCTMSAVKSVGASGYFYFKFTSTPGMQPPPGGYEAEDVSLFSEIRSFLWSNNIDQLVDWVLQPGSITELLTRASYFVSEPDAAGWGVFDATGAPRPVYQSLYNGFTGNTTRGGLK